MCMNALPACLYMHHVHAVPVETRRGRPILVTGVHAALGTEPGSSQEQQVLNSGAPSIA